MGTVNLAERRVSALELARVKCLFRREQTPACTAVILHVGVRRIPDREGAESPSFVTSVQWTRSRRAALAKHTGEKMDTTTLLVIVLVVLLLGGGGFFYRRRA